VGRVSPPCQDNRQDACVGHDPSSKEGLRS
jgi:hypothetical protein